MVGRVAADPQNNPAVEGCWTDHHLGATLVLAQNAADLDWQTRIAAPERIILRCNRRLSGVLIKTSRLRHPTVSPYLRHGRISRGGWIFAETTFSAIPQLQL